MLTLDALDSTDVMFVAVQSHCTMLNRHNPSRMWFLEIFMYLLYHFIPAIVLAYCNITLLILSHTNIFDRVRKRSIVSLLLISAMFMGCILPYSITRIVLHFDSKAVSGRTLTAIFFFHMNEYWINPVVYITTNSNFRKFTIRFLTKNKASLIAWSGIS